MPVKKEDKIKLHFKGKLKDGNVFASTEGKQPLEFKAGTGEILPGIDEAVIGMEKGEEKEITLPPQKGFGERKEELVKEFAKDILGGKEVKVDQTVMIQTQQGQRIPVRVVGTDQDKITLDLNHPLAGQETIFKIKVVNVE